MYKNDMVFGGPKVIEGAQENQIDRGRDSQANKVSLEDYIHHKLAKEQGPQQGIPKLRGSLQEDEHKLETVERERSRSKDKHHSSNKDYVGQEIEGNFITKHKHEQVATGSEISGSKIDAQIAETAMQIVKRDPENSVSREEKIRQAKERLLQRRQH